MPTFAFPIRHTHPPDINAYTNPTDHQKTPHHHPPWIHRLTTHHLIPTHHTHLTGPNSALRYNTHCQILHVASRYTWMGWMGAVEGALGDPYWRRGYGSGWGRMSRRECTHAIPQFEFMLEQNADIVGLRDVEIWWRRGFVRSTQAT